MKEKNDLNKVNSESSKDVETCVENSGDSNKDLFAEKEKNIEANTELQEEKLSNLEKCEKNSTNGSIADLELDYEDDVLEKDDLCKKTSKEEIEESLGLQEEQSTTADDGEILENSNEEGEIVPQKVKTSNNDDKDEGEISDDDDENGEEAPIDDFPDEDDLEEGEVKEVAPQTNQQTRQICRFFNNGNCTWGNQCRFLHLSLKDHGCYNMFSSNNNNNSKAFIPHVPPGMDMRLPLHHGPMKTGEFHRPLPPPIPVAKPNPPIQTAWDYSLQCAKEVIEIANERKKQELDYEEKKLHLSAEDNFQVGSHNKENYNYGKLYEPQNNKTMYNKHEEVGFGDKTQSRNRKSWSEQENPQGSVRRNNWRDRQYVETTQAPRTRADEWRDPWRRSPSPKRGSKRKRDYSSDSSVSSHSYSSHSSSYSYSDTSRGSSATSRSPSFERIYNPNKVTVKDKRGKLSPSNEPNPMPIKEKMQYSRKNQNRSTLSREKETPYRSYSSSPSRSRSRSRSQSLSNVSSASSYSSWSSVTEARENIPKIKEEPKPPTVQKHVSHRPTRTLFEEMQRLARYRDLSDAKNSNNNNMPGVPIPTDQTIPPKKKTKLKSPAKETIVIKEEKVEKVKLEHAKSIGFRRIKLMKQLQAVEDAIARKRTKFN